MVAKLAKNGDHILPTLDARKCHVLHMQVGIMDEYFEYLERTDDENAVEELGDLLFYVEGLAIPFMDDIDRTYKVRGIEETMCDLARFTKRHVFYDQDADMNLLSHVYCNLVDYISDEAKKYKATLDDVRKANMDKLAIRYPNFEYTDKRAEERADKKEKLSDFDWVVQMLHDQLDISKDSIKTESNIIKDLGGDSLDAIEIIMAIEEEFNIEITTEDEESVKTVQDILKLIQKNRHDS